MSKDTPDGDRIAKVLSRAGVASRRDAERMITEGRVKVNGKPVTSPALNVTQADKLTVDGRPVDAPEPTRLWLYHKPAGLVTSESDEMGRATVFEQMPEGMPRVMSVGRLDLTSEGLLILTNDGEVKRKLELPSTGWLRRYRVRINGSVSEAKLEDLRRGITVEGVDYQPMEVTFDRQQGANAWLTIAIREGKNREIRRVMDALGVTVNRLIRVSYGPFQLGDIAPGAVAEIPRRQVRDQLGMDDAEDGPAKKVVRSRKTSTRGTEGDRPKPTGPKPTGPVMRSTKGSRPGEDAPRPARKPDGNRDSARGDSDRPARSYDTPRAEGDRPARTYAGKPGPKPYGPRPTDADRPARTYDKPRADGDRPSRPYAGKPGPKPYGPRADADRPAYKPRAAEDGTRPARSFPKPRPVDAGERPQGKSFTPRGPKPGGDKPYGPRSDGPKSYASKSHAADRGPRATAEGPAKPYAPRGDGPRKPYAPRGDGPAKPYAPRGDGPAKPYAPRGDGPSKPYAPRADNAARPPRTDGPRPPRKGPGGGKNKPE